ncbi:MAG: histidine phosphatase family protein [Trueperaceae bacterium]|nr:histidine phosphatase family protein [Trueperaceae bacterium]
MVREVWLIRHGETDWNLNGRIQGASDVPLNATGLAQARSLACRLGSVTFDEVFASDLERARVTAETALPGAAIRCDARLRELSYGVLEGQRWDALSDELAAQARHWREDPVARRVPGGESFGDLAGRVRAFLHDLPEQGRFAAFSHGGAIVSALYGILGHPKDGAWRIAPRNTSISRLRFEARGVTFVSINDHAHLDGWAD